jgi:hypothetical protein
MSDTAAVADSAPVPDAGGAVIADTGANFTQPLGSQIPPDAVAKINEPAQKSLDDSIDRAIAKSKETQAAPKVDAKAPPAKEPAKEVPRGEGGKFAAKEPVADAAPVKDAPKPAEAAKPSHTADDAPARFTETAKAKWASADPEIRGEVQRMHRELTEGYQKYKAAAERDTELAEFHEMAQKSGTTVKAALKNYTDTEAHLRKDIVGGLEAICANLGVSLKEVAAHVMGQTPDQAASKADATIRELKQEIDGLKKQVGGVTQTMQTQQQNAVIQQINTFASDHPRFDELASDIAMFMEQGRAKDLSEAYAMAERLNPAPAQAKEELPAASSAAPDLSVQPDKGQKSINGAPSAGLTRLPGKKRAALSLDDALDRAFGAVG